MARTRSVILCPFDEPRLRPGRIAGQWDALCRYREAGCSGIDNTRTGTDRRRPAACRVAPWATKSDRPRGVPLRGAAGSGPARRRRPPPLPPPTGRPHYGDWSGGRPFVGPEAQPADEDEPLDLPLGPAGGLRGRAGAEQRPVGEGDLLRHQLGQVRAPAPPAAEAAATARGPGPRRMHPAPAGPSPAADGCPFRGPRRCPRRSGRSAWPPPFAFGVDVGTRGEAVSRPTGRSRASRQRLGTRPPPAWPAPSP